MNVDPGYRLTMPSLRSGALAGPAVLALVVAFTASAAAQSVDGPDAQGLIVTKCDATVNSCDSDARTFTMPVLGPAGRNTVLSPNRQAVEAAVAPDEYRLLIPGCSPAESGVFACGSVEEFQHCRTLMISRMINSCRIDVALKTGVAELRPAAPEAFSLAVESDARVRVTRGDRNFGQIRGKAKVVLHLDAPVEVEQGDSCMQRDSYVYFPTGPKGGLSEIGETAGCGEPIEFSFEAHEDDVLRAYDICDAFAVWGEEIEDSIEVLAAGLFHVRSTNPNFAATYPRGIAVIAPYVLVEARLTIDCRN